MEPTDLYNRNKRNLAIFAALLALVLLGGIETDDQAQILGVRISAPHLMPVALLFVTLYCLYQYWLAWQWQSDGVRPRIRKDFLITFVLSLLPISFYIVLEAPQIFLNIPSSFWTIIATLLVIIMLIVLVIYNATESQTLKKRLFSLRKISIPQTLEQGPWTLVFNQAHPKGSKPIEFHKDGTIGEGRNDNEHNWRLDGRELVIMRSDGTLQNRFRYDETKDLFVSTDDSNADAVKRGYLGQCIFKPTAN